MNGLLGAKRRDQRRVALPLRRIMQGCSDIGGHQHCQEEWSDCKVQHSDILGVNQKVRKALNAGQLDDESKHHP